MKIGEFEIDFDAKKYATAGDAAKALYKELCKLADKVGQNSDIEVRIYSPKESKQRGYCTGWQVVWEAGPFEWAIAASFEISNDKWYTEPYYSFDLCFVT